MHSRDANSPIGASQWLWYLMIVQTDDPDPRGVPPQNEGKTMQLSNVQALVQRIAPAVLLTAMFGLVCGFAAVGMVGVA
jgi:hypothetical protein